MVMFISVPLFKFRFICPIIYDPPAMGNVYFYRLVFRLFPSHIIIRGVKKEVILLWKKKKGSSILEEVGSEGEVF